MVGRGAPNLYKNNQGYVFKGDKCVKIHWIPGSIQYEGICHGLTELTAEWDSLKQAGFSKINTILPLPGHHYSAHFFNSLKYARVRYCPGCSEDLGGAVRIIAGA
ncbi:hypothetical protein FRC08_002230 [Ceratobasidium sp. 394]|nr:hypothetical protein FRC08_002230 [Ceratobasidium sp. 394]